MLVVWQTACGLDVRQSVPFVPRLFTACRGGDPDATADNEVCRCGPRDGKGRSAVPRGRSLFISPTIAIGRPLLQIKNGRATSAPSRTNRQAPLAKHVAHNALSSCVHSVASMFWSIASAKQSWLPMRRGSANAASSILLRKLSAMPASGDAYGSAPTVPSKRL